MSNFFKGSNPSHKRPSTCKTKKSLRPKPPEPPPAEKPTEIPFKLSGSTTDWMGNPIDYSCSGIAVDDGTGFTYINDEVKNDQHQFAEFYINERDGIISVITLVEREESPPYFAADNWGECPLQAGYGNFYEIIGNYGGAPPYDPMKITFTY